MVPILELYLLSLIELLNSLLVYTPTIRGELPPAKSNVILPMLMIVLSLIKAVELLPCSLIHHFWKLILFSNSINEVFKQLHM
jgi:hypothetical protein